MAAFMYRTCATLRLTQYVVLGPSPQASCRHAVPAARCACHQAKARLNARLRTGADNMLGKPAESAKKPAGGISLRPRHPSF